MKKSNFVALMLGTVSGVLFALGMCMALISEWGAFQPGILFGAAGLLLGFITLILWRRMERKAPIRLSGKTLLTALVCAVGVLALGLGMCLCMVWGRLIFGIVVGLAGIMVLLCLIPLTKGLKA